MKNVLYLLIFILRIRIQVGHQWEIFQIDSKGRIEWTVVDEWMTMDQHMA